GGVELQERALQQTGLRRHLAIREDLERATDDRDRLRHRKRLRALLSRRRLTARAAAAAGGGPANQVLVGDELVAVALKNDARERATADDEDLLVVLLQFLDERQEVAVATHDDVGIDVRMRERHLEGVQREVDVRAVLVASWREVSLHQPD